MNIRKLPGVLGQCWPLWTLVNAYVFGEDGFLKLDFPGSILAWQWRQNGCDSVSNHQPHDCFLNRLFRHRSTKTSKLRVTGLCAGIHRRPVNSPHKWPVTRKMFPFDDVIIAWSETYRDLSKVVKNQIWSLDLIQREISQRNYYDVMICTKLALCEANLLVIGGFSFRWGSRAGLLLFFYCWTKHAVEQPA